MSNVEKSKVLNKLKSVAKGAWKRSRAVEARARGGGGFPPNLKGLVAVCQTYKVAQTNNAKKDPYFALTAIVKDPEEYAGRRATFMWFINESEYATVEDNLNQLSNDLQLLGMDMPEDIADIEDVFKELCEVGRHLVFNTGGERKNGRTPNLFIQGVAEDWPDEPLEESSPKEESEDESEEETTEEETTEEETTEEETTEEEEETTEDEWVPEKGQDYYYKPKGAKSKFICKVTAVNLKKKTLTLKGGKPPKEYKDVKFTDPNITGE